MNQKAQTLTQLKIKQRNLIRLRYIPEDMQIIHKINHTLADLRPLSEIIF